MKFRRALPLLRVWPALLLAAALPAAAASKPTATKTAPSKTPASKPAKTDDGFKPFAVITQQNIFNANRGPAKPVATATAKPPRPPKIEAFALLGTMSSERGSVAFFDGTSTAYRKAAEIGDPLGAYTVAAIAHDRVTLRSGDRELCLPMQMQFRREDQGEWQLAPLPDDFQPTQPPPGQTYVARKPDARTMRPDQVRDYVMSKYERKLEQLADNPEKAEKLFKSLDKEIEGRVKKLEKAGRRMQ